MCMCVCMCVCPSFAWLASSRLERMDHTDAWQGSTTAWLPLFYRLLLSFSPLLAASSLTNSPPHFFFISLLLPPMRVFIFLSSLPPSFPFIPNPHGRRASGCHPLSTFSPEPCSASFRLPPEIIHCFWLLTKTTWPLWGLQIKKWNMEPAYSFIDFTGRDTHAVHIHTHKQTVWFNSDFFFFLEGGGGFPNQPQRCIHPITPSDHKPRLDCLTWQKTYKSSHLFRIFWQSTFSSDDMVILHGGEFPPIWLITKIDVLVGAEEVP